MGLNLNKPGEGTKQVNQIDETKLVNQEAPKEATERDPDAKIQTIDGNEKRVGDPTPLEGKAESELTVEDTQGVSPTISRETGEAPGHPAVAVDESDGVTKAVIGGEATISEQVAQGQPIPLNPPTARSEQAEREGEAADEDDVVIYSSHPMQKFSIGRKWQFENGELRLSRSEAEELDTFLLSKATDDRTRNMVKKIDPQAAEAFLKARKPVATKSIDSVDPVQQQGTQVGTKPIDS